jgi:uncharacterized protein (TIGR03437 family)
MPSHLLANRIVEIRQETKHFFFFGASQVTYCTSELHRALYFHLLACFGLAIVSLSGFLPAKVVLPFGFHGLKQWTARTPGCVQERLALADLANDLRFQNQKAGTARFEEEAMPRSRLLTALIVVLSAHGQDVLTANYDNSRTNANLAETTLRPARVKSGAFGKLFSLAVDGKLYAQPLYMKSLTFPGKGTHNVVFAATMHNTVFAFDADAPAVPLWTVNLGPAVPTSLYTSEEGKYDDITPENGILGTPVIDANTGTMYVVAATLENGRYVYRLHALDVTGGTERFGAPVEIAASVAGAGDGSASGAVAFNAAQHLQRPGLLLANGEVYIGFGSHGDGAPYHGWVVAYNAVNVKNQMAVLNTSPNGAAGAFWQSGRGLAADTNGNIYAVSGNGDTDGQSSFSDSMLRLDGTKLTVNDWFAPSNYQFLSDTDDDLGSCGAVLIDGTNQVITGTKDGTVYVLNRGNLGHTSAGNVGAMQIFSSGGWGLFNLALWTRPDGALIYLHTGDAPVSAYRLAGGTVAAAPAATSLQGINVPFQGMAVSANGVTPGTGVLWVSSALSWPLPASAVLHAYDAESLAELWNSEMAAGDSVGEFVKFANPTVANGKVYVPTGSNELVVYGPMQGTAQSTYPSVTAVANVASYAYGSLAPGEIVSIRGKNLGPQVLVTGQFEGASQTLGGLVGNTQVTFNGVPGPILYASDRAVAAIVPYEIAGANSVQVQLSYRGASSAAVTLPVAAVSPGVFSADATGSGPGAILNADYTLNTPDNPAKADDIIIVYGTGGGQTNPQSKTGSLTTGAARLASWISVTVGGRPAEVLYAGNAGGEAAGVVQLNVRLPAGVSGTLPLIVSSGEAASQATVTVSVQ